MIGYIEKNLDKYELHYGSVDYDIFKPSLSLYLKNSNDHEIITIQDDNGKLVNIINDRFYIYEDGNIIIQKPFNNRNLFRRRQIMFINILNTNLFEYLKLRCFQ